MAYSKVLVVDDDEVARESLTSVLELSGFAVTAANSVPEALKYISSENYDVLVSDLHMPGAGDGLTVVSAMRHANPLAVTLLLSAFPEMTAAAQAILQQADEILVKPMDAATLIQLITQRVAQGPPRTRETESVASILERSTESIIQECARRLAKDEKLISVAMSYQERCRHLPLVVSDLISRLRSNHPMGTKHLKSAAAVAHGFNRFQQGYSAAMLVEESRILQVSIFQTLQANLANIDYSVLLLDVMIIADEINFQLSQAVETYNEQPLRGATV